MRNISKQLLLLHEIFERFIKLGLVCTQRRLV